MKINQMTSDFEIWIDSLDIKAIAHARDLGILSGVTTNPSILSKDQQCPLKTIKSLLETYEGPLAVQVTALDHTEMINQAKALRQITERIIVKIPCIQEGYKAMRELACFKIPVMATAIYTPKQYILASYYGAHYAAPYFSRMIKLLEEDNLGVNDSYQRTLNTIEKILSLSQSRSTKVLLAAIDSVSQFDDLITIGSRYATLRSDVYQDWIKDFPKAMIDLDNFKRDWQEASFDENWLKK